MATFVFEEGKLESVLKAKTGIVAKKKAIAVVFYNNTGGDLVYDTVLASGKTEVANATCPAGHAMIVQPDGEIHVLGDAAKVGKLYATPTLEVMTVHEVAKQRGLTVPTEEMVEKAWKHLIEKNPHADGIREIPVNWLEAKGKVHAFRVTVDLPKPGWKSTQHAELDSVLVYNLLVGGGYFIGRAEFLGNWVLESDPTITGEELWQALPTVSSEEFAAVLA